MSDFQTSKYFTVQVEFHPIEGHEETDFERADEDGADGYGFKFNEAKLKAANVTLDEFYEVDVNWDGDFALVMLQAIAYADSMDEAKDAVTEAMEISCPKGWEWVEVVTFESDTDEEEDDDDERQESRKA